MAKNLMLQIAEMLGVAVGEEFKLDTCGDDIFKITKSGFWMRKSVDKNEWVEKPFKFAMLCKGDGEVVKLPWKPKFADRYFGFFEFNGKLMITRYDIWRGTVEEEAQYKCGWIFRTREEAEASLPIIAKELGLECGI